MTGNNPCWINTELSMADSAVRTLGALSYDTGTLMENLVDNLLKDPQHKAKLAEQLRDDLTNHINTVRLEGVGKEKIKLHELLSFEQVALLTEAYPEFNITATCQSFVSHPVAAASRKCDHRVLLKKIGINMREPPPIGYKVWLTDIGGNYMSYLNGMYVHCCDPPLSLRDQQREATRRQQIDQMITNRLLTTKEQEQLQHYVRADSYVRCRRRAEYCKLTSRYGIMLHSNYDITLNQLGDILAGKCIDVCYGCFIWVNEMIFEDQGFIPFLECHWVKKKNKIQYNFDNDSSFAYIHDFAVVASYALVSTFTDKNGVNRYMLELLENRKGTQYFKITRVDNVFLLCDRLSHNLYASGTKNKLLLQYFELDPSYTSSERLIRKRAIVPRDLVFAAIDYAMRITEEKFRPTEILSFLQSAASTVFVNNKDISVRSRDYSMTDDGTLMLRIAGAVYLFAYKQKYDQGKVIQMVKRAIDENRRLSERGLWARFWSNPFRFFGDWRPKERINKLEVTLKRDRYNKTYDNMKNNLDIAMITNYASFYEVDECISDIQARISDPGSASLMAAVDEACQATNDLLSLADAVRKNSQRTVETPEAVEVGESISDWVVVGVTTKTTSQTFDGKQVDTGCGVGMRRMGVAVDVQEEKPASVTSSGSVYSTADEYFEAEAEKLKTTTLPSAPPKDLDTSPTTTPDASDKNALPWNSPKGKPVLLSAELADAFKTPSIAAAVPELDKTSISSFPTTDVTEYERNKYTLPTLVSPAHSDVSTASVDPVVIEEVTSVCSKSSDECISESVSYVPPRTFVKGDFLSYKTRVSVTYKPITGGVVINMIHRNKKGYAGFAGIIMRDYDATCKTNNFVKLAHQQLDQGRLFFQTKTKTFTSYNVFSSKETWPVDLRTFLDGVSNSTLNFDIPVIGGGLWRSDGCLETLVQILYDYSNMYTFTLHVVEDEHAQMIANWLPNRLTDLGYVRMKAIGDGFCLFHAITHNIETDVLRTRLGLVATAEEQREIANGMATDMSILLYCRVEECSVEVFYYHLCVLHHVVYGQGPVKHTLLHEGIHWDWLQTRTEMAQPYELVTPSFVIPELIATAAENVASNDTVVDSTGQQKLSNETAADTTVTESVKVKVPVAPKAAVRSSVEATDVPKIVKTIDTSTQQPSGTQIGAPVTTAETDTTEDTKPVASVPPHCNVLSPGEVPKAHKTVEDPKTNVPKVLPRPHKVNTAPSKENIKLVQPQRCVAIRKMCILDDRSLDAVIRVDKSYFKDVIVLPHTGKTRIGYEYLPMKDVKVVTSLDDVKGDTLIANIETTCRCDYCALKGLVAIMAVTKMAKVYCVELTESRCKDGQLLMALTSHFTTRLVVHPGLHKANTIMLMFFRYSHHGHRASDLTELVESGFKHVLSCRHCHTGEVKTPRMQGELMLFCPPATPAIDEPLVSTTMACTEENYITHVEFSNRSFVRGNMMYLEHTTLGRYVTCGKICISDLVNTELVCIHYGDLNPDCSLEVPLLTEGISIRRVIKHSTSFVRSNELLDNPYKPVFVNNKLKDAMIEMRELWRVSAAMTKVKLNASIAEYKANKPIKDKTFGVIDAMTGAWVKQPKNKSDDKYGYVYDGQEFGQPQHNTSITPGLTLKGVTCGELYVADSTVMMTDALLYDTVKDLELNPSFDVLVDAGPPGCGKTAGILKNFMPSRDHCILTATKENRDDIRARLKLKYPLLPDDEFVNKVVTIHSYIINYHTKYRGVIYHTVFVDEAMKEHPGAVFFAALLSGCNLLHIFGDANQIPYHSRVVTAALLHSSFKPFKFKTIFKKYSYRMTVRTTAMINMMNIYNDHIMTANDAPETMQARIISNVGSIPSEVMKGAVILTHTRNTKHELKLQYPSHTIHTVGEYQGKQTEKIVLIRIQQSDNPIYHDKSQFLVAVSRHTRSFHYFTVVQDYTFDRIRAHIPKQDLDRAIRPKDDNLATKTAVIETIIKNPCRISELLAEYGAAIKEEKWDLAYMIAEHKDVTVIGDICISTHDWNSLEEECARSVDPNYLTKPRFCEGLFAEMAYMWYGVQLKCKTPKQEEREPTLKLKGGGYLIERPVIITLPEAVQTWKQPKVVRDFVSDLGKPDVKGTQYSRSPAITNVPTYECVPVRRGECLATLQHYYDMIQPQCSIRDMTYDQYLGEKQTSYYFDNVKFDLCCYRNVLKPRASMKPKLRTSCPINPVITIKSVLKGFTERNGVVPELQVPVDYDHMSEEIVQRFKTFYMDASLMEHYDKNPITVNSVSVGEWLRDQPIAVASQVEKQKYLDVSFSYYHYTMKRNPKPDLTGKGHLKYISPQMIAYSDKYVNCVFSPIAKEIKNRLMVALKNKFGIFTDYSVDGFIDFLNERMPPVDIMKTVRLEEDMQKYDKSQEWLAFLVCYKLFKAFGLPEYLMEDYFIAFTVSHFSCHQVKFSATVRNQNRSGSAFTLLINTVWLMAVLCSVLDFDYGMFLGDDSYLCGIKRIHTDTSQLIAELFNLEVKMMDFQDSLYFCSKFLIPLTPTRWTLVPDPVKLLTKLGRKDLVSYDHVEQYRISTLDNVSTLDDQLTCVKLTAAVYDRYKVKVNCDHLIGTILYFLEDKQRFASLFDDSEVQFTGVLPNLDI